MKRGSCGKNLTWTLYDDGTLIIDGTGDMDNYTIWAPWFRFNKRESIKDVIIGENIKTIGDYAFSDCYSLLYVTIGSRVAKIGDWAFGKCQNLTNVVIPDGVEEISIYAFIGCTRLKQVKFGNSVAKIGDGSFRLCSSLKNVTIPDSVNSIGNYAFSNCAKLTDVQFRNGVKEIGRNAFEDCKSLTKVIIPGSVTFVGDDAFNGCDNLKEIHYPAGRGFEKQLSMGNNAKLIPYTVELPAVTKPTTQPVTRPKLTAQPVAEKLTWSFAGKTLTVGGVREIKFFPYSKLPWLKHLHDIQRIVVGDGVEKIAAHAFEECKRLEIVTLPASVKTIGDMFASVAYCGDRFVNGGRNVFWCLEDGVLVLKKNPAAVGDDFSTGFASWIFADKNIRGVKLERGIKPTENFFEWLSSHDSAAISFG